MLRPHGPTIYRSFPLGWRCWWQYGSLEEWSHCFRMFPHTNKKMMLEGWCFPAFSKVEPNYNPKPLGFMFFFVCQMELKQTQIDTNFLCANRWQVSRKNTVSCGKSWLDKPTRRVFQIQQRFDKTTCGYVKTWAHCWKLSEESGHGRCFEYWEFAIRPSNWVTGLYCLWGLGTFVAMFAEKYSYNIHITTYCVYFAMVPIENHTTAPVSYQQ